MRNEIICTYCELTETEHFVLNPLFYCLQRKVRMISYFVNILKALSKASVLFHSYKSVECLADTAVEQIHLEGELQKYRVGAAINDPSEQLEQNQYALKYYAAQVALFGYASYRIYSGDDSTVELAVGGAAAFLTLYPKLKQGAQAMLESNAVQSVSCKVFPKVAEAKRH